jgi:hypothetical protein
MSNARIQASDRRPVEEIDAIMVKYSAWASSRAAEAPPPDGIREVTYASALQASSARRNVRTGLAVPEQKPSNETPMSARQAPKSRQPKQPSIRRPATDQAGIPAKKSPRKPASVLPKSSSGIQTANRAVSLSVRLAAEESALVRRRAAESRLSVSAYLRQCVLDVDAMRVFVEKISTELHATAAASTYPAHPAQLPRAVDAARHKFPGFVAAAFSAVRRMVSR